MEYRRKFLTEQNHRITPFNIEREMLVMVYGLEKFHYYAFGRSVTVETDQNPLEVTFKKQFSSAPPSIASMMCRI